MDKENLNNGDVQSAVEAMLFVADKPLSAKKLAEILDLDGTDTVKDALDELGHKYNGNGGPIQLREIAGGYQFSTKARFAPYIQRLYSIKPRTRLTPAALETLAIIAYRQPITKAEIETIRGVDVTNILRTLSEKDFTRVTGHRDSPGKPLTYGTTSEFLHYFGLGTLKDLPTVQELRRSF